MEIVYKGKAAPDDKLPMINDKKLPLLPCSASLSLSFKYKDWSKFPAHKGYVNKKGKSKLRTKEEEDQLSFPEMLHVILANPNYESMITWLPHGRGFKIQSKKKLEAFIMKKYNIKYLSFLRRLYSWGFRMITNKHYFHELFLRGLPHLISRMRSRRKTDDTKNQKSKVINVPEFNAFSYANPMPDYRTTATLTTTTSSITTTDQNKIDNNVKIVNNDNNNVLESLLDDAFNNSYVNHPISPNANTSTTMNTACNSVANKLSLAHNGKHILDYLEQSVISSKEVTIADKFTNLPRSTLAQQIQTFLESRSPDLKGRMLTQILNWKDQSDGIGGVKGSATATIIPNQHDANNHYDANNYYCDPLQDTNVFNNRVIYNDDHNIATSSLMNENDSNIIDPVMKDYYNSIISARLNEE